MIIKKLVDKKIQCYRFSFTSIGVRVVLRYVFSITKSGSITNFPEKKLRRKNHFTKHFIVSEIFQNDMIYSWWFNWYFRTSNDYQWFLPQTYYLMKWIGVSYMKKYILLHTINIVFIKNCYGWFKLLNCSYTCREKILYKKDNCV